MSGGVTDGALFMVKRVLEVGLGEYSVRGVEFLNSGSSSSPASRGV